MYECTWMCVLYNQKLSKQVWEVGRFFLDNKLKEKDFSMGIDFFKCL